MNEEERLKRIRSIQIQKDFMNQLKAKRAELKRLKSNDIVKIYLSLSKELDGVNILSAKKIQENAFSVCTSECNHDFWINMGGRRDDFTARDFQVYYEIDYDMIDYYLLKCLDCEKEIEVPKKDLDYFLSNHRVLQVSKPIVTIVDYKEWQRLYRKLLLTNTVENTYQKFLKKIK